MKRLFFSTISAMALLLFFSCNNSDKQTTSTSDAKDNSEKPAVAKPAGDITGTYTTTEDNMPMQFVLNADGKGHENYHGDIRPFSWTKKDGKVFFTYDGETNEFELPIVVEKGEIHYGSLIYKKE